MARRDGTAGRPRTISSRAILTEARRMVTDVGVSDFSVRELAKSLGLVPGTIHARFGNKDELLAQLYLQSIEEVMCFLDALSPDDLTSITVLTERIAPLLDRLHREFVLHFEPDLVSSPRLRSETWRALQQQFKRFSQKLYARVRQAAAAEGVELIGGSLAERLVWSLLSTMGSQRLPTAFGHEQASYTRFVARTFTVALRA